MRKAITINLCVMAWIGTLAVAGHRLALSMETSAFFESKVRPVLAKHCYSCHSGEAEHVGGNLRLDSMPGISRGGESGSAIDRKSPSDSLLLVAMRHEHGLEMPPQYKLSNSVVEDFEEWGRLGLPHSADFQREPILNRELADSTSAAHWAFQPLRDALPINGSKNDWGRQPLDDYILSGLKSAGQQPGKDADPRIIARRLSVDLTGLLPSREELRLFLAAYETNPEVAITNFVDELLGSPHFGERWGQHWLDLARFAESNGNDGLGRNVTFPHAWRYRDYVIDALNSDMPFDQFLTEQLAGDLMSFESPQVRNRKLIATGFLALGCKPAVMMNRNFRMDLVDEQIQTTATVFMGLSVGCARCHDHKHEEISTKDYYALAGVFCSSQILYGNAADEELTAPPTPLHELVATGERKTDPGQMGTDVSGACSAYVSEDSDCPHPGWAMGVREAKKMQDCRVHVNGDRTRLGDTMRRSVLPLFEGELAPQAFAIDEETSGRLQLAKWLSHPSNPLTPRVMVNRIWAKLMGIPIVATPNDFGRYGATPSHPLLLDHLALRFRHEGWSIKKIVRYIVLSRSYRLAAVSSGAEQRLLISLFGARERRRLDAETLRDVMLQVSGDLDRLPPFGSDVSELDVLINFPPGTITFEHNSNAKRSVYQCQLRDFPSPELAAYSTHDSHRTVSCRDKLVQPTQGLFLMNSDFVRKRAAVLAARIVTSTEAVERSRSEEHQVFQLYLNTLQRAPAENERERLLEFVEAERRLDDGVTEQEIWTRLCHALLMSNEFRHVE